MSNAHYILIGDNQHGAPLTAYGPVSKTDAQDVADRARRSLHRTVAFVSSAPQVAAVPVAELVACLDRAARRVAPAAEVHPDRW